MIDAHGYMHPRHFLSMYFVCLLTQALAYCALASLITIRHANTSSCLFGLPCNWGLQLCTPVDKSYLLAGFCLQPVKNEPKTMGFCKSENHIFLQNETKVIFCKLHTSIYIISIFEWLLKTLFFFSEYNLSSTLWDFLALMPYINWRFTFLVTYYSMCMLVCMFVQIRWVSLERCFRSAGKDAGKIHRFPAVWKRSFCSATCQGRGECLVDTCCS